MNFPKYKRGDLVETAYGTKCVVIRWHKDNMGRDRYMVEYSDSKSRVELNESDIKFRFSDLKEAPKVTDFGKTCPKCLNAWQITNIGASRYLDCLTCEKKAEDIVRAYKNSPVVPKNKPGLQLGFDFDRHDVDLEAAFEAMLNGDYGDTGDGGEVL